MEVQMKHLYWVGIKESEIRTCRHLFEGSVTFIGTGKNGNISFSATNDYVINYNEESIELDNFMKETLHMLIRKVPDISFLCYTPSYIFSLEDEEINKHIICANNRNTLQLLRNKMNCRFWLNKYVPVLPTIILSGSECNYTYLCSLFPSETAFTIQGCTGAGGIDTFIMSIDNQSDTERKLLSNCIYLISPYKEMSYSVNVHVLFTQDEYCITPGSIQIVEYQEGRMIYKGADFVEYPNISCEIREKIIANTKIIAKKIQHLPYNGLLGIDYLVVNSDVFFLEINPRFQSSTPMLNLALKDAGLPSIQEFVINSFYPQNDLNINTLEKIKVCYSSYIIDYESKAYDYKFYLKNMEQSNEKTELVLDGYYDDMKCQYGASVFSITFKKNIVSINPNGHYNIYDNVRPFIRKKINLKSIADCKWLKFSLMNQGINFTNAAVAHLSSFQKGVYSSFDIFISDLFIVNAPAEMPFYSLSPFKIDYINNRLKLFYGYEFISDIHIPLQKEYCSKYTKSGINFQHISFIATDRLRIHHSPNCLFQTEKKGCKFCDVPGNSINFQEEDINEVIDWHLCNSNFHHILIGGASGDYPKEYVNILKIINYIRQKSDKQIYLMTLPPHDCAILHKYYDAGVNEIAFNIEIFDRSIAKKMMPGKGQIPLNTYQNALLHSVELWGNTGNVRSLLVYGLESDSSFLEGIKWLSSNGIQPIISPFRALGGTECADSVPPTTQKLMQIYDEASSICEKYNLSLGPNCIFCQNNTLSFHPHVTSCFDS